jgi:hypothetical protein
VITVRRCLFPILPCPDIHFNPDLLISGENGHSDSSLDSSCLTLERVSIAQAALAVSLSAAAAAAAAASASATAAAATTCGVLNHRKAQSSSLRRHQQAASRQRSRVPATRIRDRAHRLRRNLRPHHKPLLLRSRLRLLQGPTPRRQQPPPRLHPQRAEAQPGRRPALGGNSTDARARGARDRPRPRPEGSRPRCRRERSRRPAPRLAVQRTCACQRAQRPDSCRIVAPRPDRAREPPPPQAHCTWPVHVHPRPRSSSPGGKRGGGGGRCAREGEITQIRMRSAPGRRGYVPNLANVADLLTPLR